MERVDSARDDLNEVNFQLSRQIASLALEAVASGGEQLVEYRTARAAQAIAMKALAAETRLLGSSYAVRFAALQKQSEVWHAAVDRYLAGKQATARDTRETAAFEANYPAVIEAISRLDEAMTAVQTGHRNEVRRLTRLQMYISMTLVLPACVAAITALWMVARLRTLAIVLAQESDERMAALGREVEVRRTAETLVKSRDEILGVVSHDLRSPLTTIALSTQLMAGSSPEEQKEHVDMISAATRRMERLIQDLVDATKVENSTLSIRRDPLEPEVVVREALTGHKPIAAEKNIDLVQSIQTPLPKLCGDRDRLLQALSNLLGNALKFTPNGGTVRLEVQRVDQRVRFTVEDSGPGIALNDIPHLFEPFWQAKKTAHLGAGLGLKITRAIIEAHGGVIRVFNVPAGGACFTFDLPADGEALL